MLQHYRPGTMDESIFKEVVESDCYRVNGLTFLPSDIVIDIGAHIGSFTTLAVARGAGRILAFEPDRDNYGLLVRNCEGLPGVSAYPYAVDTPGNLYYWRHRDPTHTGSGRVAHYQPAYPSDGYGIWSVGLPQVLLTETSRLPLRFLKMDCEGSEWTILAPFRDSASIPFWQIAMEVHGEHRDLVNLDNFFSDRGYHVSTRPVEDPNRFVAGFLYAIRRDFRG